MADLSANIGANFSQYTGDANLGGGVDVGVLNIDTKPLQNLGYYTMLYNKAAQEQKQKDIEKQAAQLADLTAYDLTTAIPKDREIIQKEYNDLYQYARANPTVLDYKNNPKGWLEFNKKKNDFSNRLKSAKTRSILYKTRENEIAAEKNPSLKAILQNDLAKEVADTDIETAIKATQQYDLTVPDIPSPQIKTFDVSVIEDNQNVKREYNLPDVKGAWDAAHATVLGMLDKTLDEKSPEFISKTPEEQSLLRSQSAQRKAGKTSLPIEQANQFNAALQQYMSTDEPGQVDIELIKAKNPILFGVIQQYENYNNFAKNISDQIRAGVFKDKLGNTVQFGTNGLDESDFRPISYTDGITPDEIVFLQSMAKAKPAGYKTTVQPTDNKLQQDQLEQKTINDAENRAIERAKLALTKKQWETNLNGSETIKNAAWKFGQDIIGQLNKVATEGYIFPDKFGKLNNEILMALGSEQPEVRDADGKITKQAGFYPLELKDGNILRIDGDNVYVYNKPGEVAANPNNSTSLANIATNRLLREVKASGGKEIGLFNGVDETKGPEALTSGKSKSSSGSSNSIKGVTYSKIEEDGINKVLLANPGATRESVIEALRKASKIK